MSLYRQKEAAVAAGPAHCCNNAGPSAQERHDPGGLLSGIGPTAVWLTTGRT